MTEPIGYAQPQAASAATSSTQRIDTSTGDQAQPRSELNSQQSAVEVGGSIPIVFGKRTGSIGGVWLDPPVAEARIENSTGNEVSISYRLVLSDGQIGSVDVPDVFQGDRQRGAVEFAYNERAGDWEPGSFLQQRWDRFEYNEETEISSGPDQQLELTVRSRGNNVTYFRVDHTNVSPGAALTQLPDYTASANVSLSDLSFEPSFTETGDLAGKSTAELTQYFRQAITEIDRPPMPLPKGFAYTGQGTGSFEGMSSLSYTETFTRAESEDGAHLLQVHVFVREGLYVERLTDNYSIGPSDLLPDLALYLLQSRLALQLVDYEILEEAAKFCERQGMRFNGVLSAPTNIRDLLNRLAPLNLLTVVQREGNIGLRPSLPYNAEGDIYVGPTQPRCLFDEGTIVAGSFQMQYVPASDRALFSIEVLWRQQPEGNVGLIRATRITYSDTPEDAPVEQYDLSDFCTDHVHAVKVATAILSRRRHITHTASMTALPGGYAGALIPGDIVEVALSRESSADRTIAVSRIGQQPTVRDHHYHYQVNSVATDRQGNVSLELTHWPVDASGASLIALDIQNVDPGSVSLDDTGLPQPVNPVDPLFSEQFVDNYFTTLTFLPVEEVNGFYRICVQSSRPILNGDLVLTLNVGYQLVIEEGETIGCVDVPISLDLIDSLTDDLDTIDFDDLTFPGLDDLLDTLGDLNDDTQIGDLNTGDLIDVITGLVDLCGLFTLSVDTGQVCDLTSLYDCIEGLNTSTAVDSLTAEQQQCIDLALQDLNLDLGDLDGLSIDDLLELVIDQIDLGGLEDLTVDQLESLLGDLSLEDLEIDLGDLDLTGLLDLDGLVIDTNIDGIVIDIDDLEIDPVTVVDVDAPDGYDVSTNDLDIGIEPPGSLGDINLNLNLNLNLNFEDVSGDEAGCVGPSVGLYFHELTFVGTTLVVKLRLTPSGVAPAQNLGSLNATIQSGTTVARIGPGGPLVSPQPTNLPTVNFTGLIASPDPSPSPGEIYQGEFQIQYPIDTFPTIADPQIVYEMPIFVSSVSGGFCNVSIQNTGLAIFEPTSGNVPWIVVVNSNGAKDDIFQIIYGGSVLGTCDFSPDGELTAYLFIWSGDPAAINAAKSAAGSYVYRQTFTVASSYPSPGSNATLTMNNIGQNNNGNRGDLIWGRSQSGQAGSIEWAPGDGQDFVTQLSWPS